jgi:hypothetical protein
MRSAFRRTGWGRKRRRRPPRTALSPLTIPPLGHHFLHVLGLSADSSERCRLLGWAALDWVTLSILDMVWLTCSIPRPVRGGSEISATSSATFPASRATSPKARPPSGQFEPAECV